jgi:hypothetical protein
MLDLNVAIDPADVLDALIQTRDDDALFEFIVDLDAMMVDWDFTERLYKHFKMLHKEYKDERNYLKELYSL